MAPFKAPSDITPPPISRGQRLLLSVICLLGAAVCAVGVYLWRLWPEQWQAGLVFVLFGLLVLAPVTIKEIQSRRKAQLQPANWKLRPVSRVDSIGGRNTTSRSKSRNFKV